MNYKLKSKINQAIDKTFDDMSGDGLWDGWIHPELVSQMTNAAEQVFDAAMNAQKFAQEQEVS